MTSGDEVPRVHLDGLDDVVAHAVDDALTAQDFVAGYLLGSARMIGDVEPHVVLGTVCPSFTLDVAGYRLVVHVDRAIA